MDVVRIEFQVLEGRSHYRFISDDEIVGAEGRASDNQAAQVRKGEQGIQPFGLTIVVAVMVDGKVGEGAESTASESSHVVSPRRLAHFHFDASETLQPEMCFPQVRQQDKQLQQELATQVAAFIIGWDTAHTQLSRFLVTDHVINLCGERVHVFPTVESPCQCGDLAARVDGTEAVESKGWDATHVLTQLGTGDHGPDE